MRVAWLTDIHLNFVEAPQIDQLCEAIRQTDAEAVLITGDISESHTLVAHLEGLADRLDRPIYYVLGNHDFYRGTIDEVRSAARFLGLRRPSLRWLPCKGVVRLTESYGLIGVDGWSDARLGNYDASPLMLNDYRLIGDLVDLEQAPRRKKLESLGDAEAGRLRELLQAGCSQHPRLLVLTHVPPFREACGHPGRHAWDDWLPHFTSQAMGDALVEAAEAYPDREITVLCGHVHTSNDVWIRPNLRVLTGGAEYRIPAVQGVLTLD